MDGEIKKQDHLYIGIGIGLIVALVIVALMNMGNSTSLRPHKDLLISDVWVSDTTNIELEFFESGTGNYRKGSMYYDLIWTESKDADGQYRIKLVNAQTLKTIDEYDLRFENDIPILIATFRKDRYKRSQDSEDSYVADISKPIEKELSDEENIGGSTGMEQIEESTASVHEQNTTVDYANGECGQNLHWALSVDGLLTISGTGEMSKFTYDDTVPWDDFRDLIIEVIIKDGVTSVGRYAFQSCENLKSISLPKSITKIEYSAFQSCTSLESIVLPDAVKELPEQAFSRCTSLKSVTLPDELEQIMDYAFNECTSLTEISLPSKAWYVGNKAFEGCSSLKAVYLPDDLSVLGNAAFFRCTSLQSITIPAQVDHLSDVFMRCTSLREVYFEGDAPVISDRTFEDVTATCYYPSGNNTWTISKMADYGGNLTWEGEKN